MALVFNVITMIECVMLQEICYGPDVTRHFTEVVFCMW